MFNIFAIGAIVAGIIAIVAYIPQVKHLVTVKDSKGISVLAWLVWLLCNSLLLAYAISIVNIPYMIADGLSCLANLTIIILAIKYKK
ncbi:MAG: PQ-loop domain-containing transporter [Candidatus Staskawiczbacteria bacterium]|nr:PQ-loop domain-containing transporter [Candidatus Staskawiczbacteria bacterium]